jgi:hypothetical protein
MSELQLGFDALERAAARADRRSLIEKLVDIAQGLARVRPEGVTVGDVRAEAVRQCILTGKPKGRELAFLGAVMKRAGLIATEEFRRSDVEGSHGNLHRVWVARG